MAKELDWDGLFAFLRDAYDAGREDGVSSDPQHIDGADYAKTVVSIMQRLQDGDTELFAACPAEAH